MNKNYHVKRLLNIITSPSFIIPGLRVIAEDANQKDRLLYSEIDEVFRLEVHRDNAEICIAQSLNAPAAFGLELHQYNGNEPYITVSVGGFISVLHLVK